MLLAVPIRHVNLGAAAHLIHGSSEGRFGTTYAPRDLTWEEVEGAGFRYAELGDALARHNAAVLKDGINVMFDGEESIYISDPAIGLWSAREWITRHERQ